MFLHLSVSHSVHRGASATPPGQTHPQGRDPPGQTRPWADTPLGRHAPGQTRPWADAPLWQTPPLRSACWDTVNNWNAFFLCVNSNIGNHATQF